MKNTDLLQYIGEIDDKYIAECERAMTPKAAECRWGISQWRRAAVLLAVLVVFFTSAITVEALRPDQPVLRYDRSVLSETYRIWANYMGMEKPVSSRIDVRYTIPKLPEEFYVTRDQCHRSMESNGTMTGPTESLQQWENWRGHSITLQQYLLNTQCRIDRFGELQSVKVDGYYGYMCKGVSREVIVWATKEYLFVLELRGVDATRLGLEALAESIVPEDSVQPPEEEEKEHPDLNLQFAPRWNYQTICRNAYIDEERHVHFSPEFLAEVPEAAQYEQRRGARAVWNMRDTGFVDHEDEEVFVLWDDGSVTFLHVSEENFRKKYKHSTDPVIHKIEKSSGVRYYLDEKWQKLEIRLMRWRSWEKLLEGKRVAWIFDNENPGMVLTDGTLIYFPHPQYTVDRYTGKPSAESNRQTTSTIVRPVAGMHIVSVMDPFYILTTYGVIQVETRTEGVHLRAVWSNPQIVQVDEHLILKSDGWLEVKKDSGKYYRVSDEQYVRIFPGTGYGLTVDNRLVKYLHFVDGPDEIPLKEGGKVDQLTDDLVVVYEDGTIQYPTDVPGAAWLATVQKVQTLPHVVMYLLPEAENEILPVPEEA